MLPTYSPLLPTLFTWPVLFLLPAPRRALLFGVVLQLALDHGQPTGLPFRSTGVAKSSRAAGSGTPCACQKKAVSRAPRRGPSRVAFKAPQTALTGRTLRGAAEFAESEFGKVPLRLGPFRLGLFGFLDFWCRGRRGRLLCDFADTGRSRLPRPPRL